MGFFKARGGAVIFFVERNPSHIRSCNSAGLWAVGRREDMAEMSIAFGADNFSAPHEEAVILIFGDGIFACGRVEAGPARAAVIFCLRRKELLAAAYTEIIAVALFVPMRPGEGALGSGLAGDVILLRRELVAPDLVILGVFRALTQREERGFRRPWRGDLGLRFPW